MSMTGTGGKDKGPGIGKRIARLRDRAAALWQYCSQGVWTDHRDILKVNVVKTLNLTVRTFFSADLQTKACAMTYRTMLAVVPALALLFAIGRGFGFQNIVQTQLFNLVPSQRQALEVAIGFVDKALAQASEGIFVGVGLVFLLWTVISLLDSVEETFNEVWGVSQDRSIFRKLTDYLAICIILPILMICSGGLQVLMSSAIQRILPAMLSPVLEFGLDCVSVVLTWLFFMGAYKLIPNVKVRWQNALIAGVLAGSAFQVLQWLFLTGQLYVAKYNAIYGSFSFLPLMLIWMQLSWLITLAGALVCRASQDISLFSFEQQSSDISADYRFEVETAVLTVVVSRFARGLPPLAPSQISRLYNVPPRLLAELLRHLERSGLIDRILPQGTPEDADPMMLPVAPAKDVSYYTLGQVAGVLFSRGASGFIPGFRDNFADVSRACSEYRADPVAHSSVLLKDIPYNSEIQTVEPNTTTK